MFLEAVVRIHQEVGVMATYPKSRAAFAFSDAVGLLREPGVWVGGLVLFGCFSLGSTVQKSLKLLLPLCVLQVILAIVQSQPTLQGV
jgi:hypothetical protein